MPSSSSSFKTAAGVIGRLNASKGRRSGPVAAYNKLYAADARQAMTEINRKFSTLVQTMEGIAPKVLKQVLEPTLELAKFYTPVNTGELLKSGKMETSNQPHKPKVTIRFGNADVDYAALVHENLEAYHTPPTRAKYLQTAMEETVDDMRDVFARYYRELLGTD